MQIWMTPQHNDITSRMAGTVICLMWTLHLLTLGFSGILSHQALLLQAQDDEVENKEAESQDSAIQYPKFADCIC